MNPYLLVLQAYLQRQETRRGGGTPQEAMHSVKWDGAFYDMFEKVSTLFRNWHILVEFRDCIVQALTETRFKLVKQEELQHRQQQASGFTSRKGSTVRVGASELRGTLSMKPVSLSPREGRTGVHSKTGHLGGDQSTSSLRMGLPNAKSEGPRKFQLAKEYFERRCFIETVRESKERQAEELNEEAESEIEIAGKAILQVEKTHVIPRRKSKERTRGKKKISSVPPLFGPRRGGSYLLAHEKEQQYLKFA